MNPPKDARKPQQVIIELIGQLEGQSCLLDMLYSMIDRVAIQHALVRHQDNQSQAAKYLGISRTTLRKKMAALGMEPAK